MKLLKSTAIMMFMGGMCGYMINENVVVAFLLIIPTLIYATCVLVDKY